MSEPTSSGGQYSGFGALESFSAVLKNFDGTRAVDISNLVTEISIFEDIFKKTMYGSMQINDAVNLLNGLSVSGSESKANGTFPIVGEEFIEFEYKVSGQDSVFKRFFVYSIKEVNIEPSQLKRRYTVQFCSEEHLFDSTILVQKAYKDSIDNIAKDILVNYLKVDEQQDRGKRKKKYNIQKTKGTQQIVVPRLSPLETMDFLSKRSVAESEFNSGTFLFFENKDGFNFCDIEHLIRLGKRKYTNSPDDYQYYYQNPNIDKRQANKLESKDKTFKTFISFKQKHRFDTIEKLKRGYFESEVLIYDFINRRVKTNTFKFKDEYKDFNVMGSETGQAFPENSVDFVDSVTSDKQTFWGMFNFMKDKPEKKNTKVFFIPQDSSKPETYLEAIYPRRSSYLTRMAQNMFTAEIYGDPKIAAGDVILLNINEIVGTTNEVRQLDPYLSGYFMITSIHHKLTPESYMCVYDLYKNSYGQSIVNNDSGKTFESSKPFTF